MYKPTINLYVDDLRDFPKDFVIARDYDNAISLLINNNIDILSLDHDLGEDKEGNILPSGYDIVKYICENGIKIKKIYLHTDNPVGRDNMYETLLGARRRGFIDKDTEIFRYPFVENKYTSKR